MGLDDPDQVAIGGILGGLPNRAFNRNTRNPRLVHNRQLSTIEQPDSPATRPEDLGVRSWYNEQFGTTESPSSSVGGGICDRSSYPSSSSNYPYPHGDGRSLTVARPNLSLYSVTGSRERESSLESNDTAPAGHRYAVPRKAYMDLTDAIALLDETCPNQEPSPSLTPRTPRTPLTPFPRSKRARSKSSDNSSNYSNEITSAERTLETSKSQEKPQETKHRRPFLRKIGVSKTEDRPFFAKITPKVIGKPYLEKIGPSRAVEKPFLEKIGSSKTLDRFTFDALREFPKVMVKKCSQTAEPSPLTIDRTPHPTSEQKETLEHHVDHDDVLCIIKDERDDEDDEDNDDANDEETEGQSGRRSNGKGYLLKMYSFESDCLDEGSDATVCTKAHRDPLRAASLDDVLDSGPSSFPPSEDSHEHPSSRSDDRSASVAELVKCRVTTSEEIFSTIMSHQSSPREAASWGNSPNRWSKRRSRRVVSATRTRPERDQNVSLVFRSDESTPNSPTKRRISPDRDESTEDRAVLSRTKNSSASRDSIGSPLKSRRQASNEEAGSSDSRRDVDTSKSSQPSSEENVQQQEELVGFSSSKSRRQTFKEAMDKFSGSDNSSGKTRRQVSEDILDKNRKNGQLPRFDDPPGRLERRGISSDNLKLSRETVVASVPSTSSLGYQSGDSSLVSQRSSYHSQDFIRGTLKILHDKFELQEVPSESYAAFKRRTRANHQFHHQKDKQQRTNMSDSRGKDATTPTNNNNHNNESKSNDNNNETTNADAYLAKESNESGTLKDNSTRSASEDLSTESKSSITTKSVLRKQEGVDHESDEETEGGTSHRRPKRRMVNEPSQETMDLLTELRRVKSMLKTPSFEADGANDFSRPPPRFPKKILLTDKEFCLSVERENSVRRRPSMLEDLTGLSKTTMEETEKENEEKRGTNSPKKSQPRCSRRERALRGPALFEKRCLSLDYADDERPPKPEARAISLVASSRTPRSGTADYDNFDSSDPGGSAYDARSYSSDVFTSPSDENDEPRVMETGRRNSAESPETHQTTTNTMNNHCAEVDIAIPVDHVGSISPKRRIHAQGRTSDFYEIISPRSTPFRVKKRLGRISVEEGVKPESFTLNKVDCRSVVNQKRTKCFPL